MIANNLLQSQVAGAEPLEPSSFSRVSSEIRNVVFHDTVNQANTYLGLGVSILSKIGAIAGEMVKISGREWKHINTALKGMPYLGLIACSDIPFELNGMIDDVADFVQGNTSEKWDCVLLFVGRVGTIGESVACVAQSVANIWETTAPVLAWADPLYIVSGLLSSVTIIYNTKGWMETKVYLSEFEKAAGLKKEEKDYTIEDYRNGLHFLFEKRVQQGSLLQQHFKMEDRHLTSLLTAQIYAMEIGDGAPGSPDYEKQVVVLRKNMKALRSRVQDKIRSNQLGVLISTVSLVALTVGVFSPCPLAGIGVGSAACALTVAKMIHDKAASHRFDKSLKLNELALKVEVIKKESRPKDPIDILTQ